MIKTLTSRFLILFISITAINTFAGSKDEQKTWTIGGQNGLQFSQVSLSNWAAGGDNSLAANGFLHLHANYKKKNVIWDSIIR